ncbi:rod-binding protein [Mobilitalea sibirica]|uniref:Rod-binding protein n=1 Tax=Mobilitalea sibirica TaxID=1462919 RepID=A0A8J7HC62_9FIRM|nr:rod-binding protein [Mobilitalea sibirica]MBH1942451.1 rod-binding protein [Mobilitalea sibirica]
MGIAIGSDAQYFATTAGMTKDKVNVKELQEKLKNKPASDEELMEVCKSFESYMLEQVFKEMDKTIPKEEDKNPYLEQFGDMLYQEYAKNATLNEGIGIAKVLYEAMKRNA